MNTSVIIPLYNAEKYIARALDSCLALSVVEEIIVVDDGHKDNARAIVEEYSRSYSKIKIFQHPNRENRGAGASRNLGIKMATQEYLAFLDADDFYLPNRFEKDKEVFDGNKEADGCFNAIGVHYYSKKERLFFQNNFKEKELTTVNSAANPTPCNLMEGIIVHKEFGSFSLDGLTLKRERLLNTGLMFNERLRLHQDTDFIIKLAFYLRIYPSQIKQEVARRGIHEDNRITANAQQPYYEKYQNQFLLWDSLYQWWGKQNFNDPKIYSLLKNRYDFYFFAKNPNPKFTEWIKINFRRPSILRNYRYYRLNYIYTQKMGRLVRGIMYAVRNLIIKIN